MDNIDNFIEIEEEVTESGVNTEETSDKPKKEKKLKFKAKKEKKEKKLSCAKWTSSPRKRRNRLRSVLLQDLS